MSEPKSESEIKELEAALKDSILVHDNYRQRGGVRPLPHLTRQIVEDAYRLLEASGDDEQIAKLRGRLPSVFGPTCA